MGTISINSEGIKVDNQIKYNFNDSYVNFEKANSDKVVFEKASASSIRILAGLKVRVGSVDVSVSENITLDLNTDLDTGSKTAGLDYFVYAKDDGTFYLSADMNKSDSSNRLIGGFHYSLVAEDEEATGNKTEDDMVAIRGINKYSFWDLKWRPTCDPRGMVYVLGKWYDIYLTDSEYGLRKYSAPSVHSGANIAGGGTDHNRQYPKIPLEFGGDGDVDYGSYTWFQACEVVGAAGKSLISYEEFQKVAYGVKEGIGANAQNSDYDSGDNEGKVTHYPEFVSKWGIEQATGNEWIWGKDVGGNRDEGETSWEWHDKAGGRGQIYALHDNHITAAIFGAHRGYGDDGEAGSRCSNWSHCVWNSYWDIGSVAVGDHLKLV
jgi:hypothetical protein